MPTLEQLLDYSYSNSRRSVPARRGGNLQDPYAELFSRRRTQYRPLATRDLPEPDALEKYFQQQAVQKKLEGGEAWPVLDAVWGGAQTVLHALSAGEYAIASTIREIIDEKRQADDVDPVSAFFKGLAAGFSSDEEYKTTMYDVLGSAGWNPDTTEGKVGKAILGFGLSIAVDPLTYVGLGPLKASRLGRIGAKDIKGLVGEFDKYLPAKIKRTTAGDQYFSKNVGQKILTHFDKLEKGPLTKTDNAIADLESHARASMQAVEDAALSSLPFEAGWKEAYARKTRVIGGKEVNVVDEALKAIGKSPTKENAKWWIEEGYKTAFDPGGLKIGIPFTNIEGHIWPNKDIFGSKYLGFMGTAIGSAIRNGVPFAARAEKAFKETPFYKTVIKDYIGNKLESIKQTFQSMRGLSAVERLTLGEAKVAYRRIHEDGNMIVSGMQTLDAKETTKRFGQHQVKMWEGGTDILTPGEDKLSGVLAKDISLYWGKAATDDLQGWLTKVLLKQPDIPYKNFAKQFGVELNERLVERMATVIPRYLEHEKQVYRLGQEIGKPLNHLEDYFPVQFDDVKNEWRVENKGKGIPLLDPATMERFTKNMRVHEMLMRPIGFGPGEIAAHPILSARESLLRSTQIALRDAYLHHAMSRWPNIYRHAAFVSGKGAAEFDPLALEKIGKRGTELDLMLAESAGEKYAGLPKEAVSGLYSSLRMALTKDDVLGAVTKFEDLVPSTLTDANVAFLKNGWDAVATDIESRIAAGIEKQSDALQAMRELKGEFFADLNKKKLAYTLQETANKEIEGLITINIKTGEINKGLGEFARLQRIEEKGITTSLEKPQGLYLTAAGKKSPHEFLGGGKTQYFNKAKNPLDVSSEPPLPIRENALDSGAGARALKLLDPDYFNKLMGMSVKGIREEIKERFPKLSLTGLRDKQEYLEVVGAEVARRKGYDSIIDKDIAGGGEFSEFVALKAGVLEPVSGDVLLQERLAKKVITLAKEVTQRARKLGVEKHIPALLEKISFTGSSTVANINDLGRLKDVLYSKKASRTISDLLRPMENFVRPTMLARIKIPEIGHSGRLVPITNYVMDPKILTELQQFVSPVNLGQISGPIYHMWSWATNQLKKLLTGSVIPGIPRLAFFARNFIDQYAKRAMGLSAEAGMGSWDDMMHAFNITMGKEGKLNFRGVETTYEEMRQFFETMPMWNSGWGSLGLRQGDVESIIRSFSESASTSYALRRQAVMANLGKVSDALKAIDPQRLGSLSDNLFIAEAAIAQGKRNVPWAQAVENMRRNLFDYSNLTAFEKGLSNIVMFYGFQRQALPFVLRQLAERPIIFNAAARMSDLNWDSPQEEAMIPQWVRDYPHIRLSMENGKIRVASLRNVFTIDSMADMFPMNAGEFIGKLNPLVTLPIECFLGKDLYTRQDIPETKYIQQEMSKVPEWTPFLNARTVNAADGKNYLAVDGWRWHVLRRTWFSRLFREADTFFQTLQGQQDVYQSAMNFMLGVKLYQYDVEKQMGFLQQEASVAKSRYNDALNKGDRTRAVKILEELRDYTATMRQ